MANHDATHRDLIVNHYYNGAQYTAYELCADHGHTVEIDGNKSEGYALALRCGDIGTYAQSLPLRTFRTVAAAKAVAWHGLAVDAVRGLDYINR